MADQSIRRVIYATSVDPSLPNGPGVNEREFVLALHHRFGAAMTAIVPRPARPLEDFAPVNVRYLSGRRELSRPLDFLRAEREMAATVLAEVGAGDYDLLITRQRGFPYGFEHVSRRLPIPFALRHMTSRQPADAVVGRGPRQIALRVTRPFDHAIWRKLAARALAIDTPTAPYADLIARHFRVERDKIFVKDNTVNTTRFQPGGREAARAKLGLGHFGRIVGYAGGSADQRGGEQMFRGAPAILARRPDTGFVIVGGGAGMEGLKARIAAAGLAHAFVTPGVVPYEQVPDYISSFDVGVALDVSDREQRLGSAHQKVRQYLATGVPVVAGSGGVLVDQGLAAVAPPNDPAAFEAAVLGWLAMDDAARADFRERARRYAVDNLSAAASLDRQIEFWEQRLARTAPR